MRQKALALLLVSFIFLTAGCSEYKFRRYLRTQTNVMTYDRALAKWGEPKSVTQEDQILTATWEKDEKGLLVVPVGNTIVAMPHRDRWRLTLAFEKTTKKLVKWNYKRW